MDNIKQLIFTLLLIIGIAVEIVVGVKLFKEQKSEETDFLIEYAMEEGKSNISVTEIFSFPEAPAPYKQGDVIDIKGNRIKLNGNMTDESNRHLGYIYYSTIDTKESRLLTFTDKDSNLTEFHLAVNSYLSGKPDSLVGMVSAFTDPTALTYYQQNHTDGAIPIIYDSVSEEYYMFLDCDTNYIIIHAKDKMYVTDDKLTVHYGKPDDNPQRNHEFNVYEVAAVTNQRNQMTNGTYDGDPIKQGTASSSAATYSSQADDTARDVLISYGKYKWAFDGTSNETSMHIDTTSVDAKKSEWILSADRYSYTTNGLTIENMEGKRSNSMFSVKGTLRNNIDAERKWVMCIKFMDRNNGLLGIRVIDNRSSVLPALGNITFQQELSASEEIPIQDIYAIQFEVH